MIQWFTTFMPAPRPFPTHIKKHGMIHLNTCMHMWRNPPKNSGCCCCQLVPAVQPQDWLMMKGRRPRAKAVKVPVGELVEVVESFLALQPHRKLSSILKEPSFCFLSALMIVSFAHGLKRERERSHLKSHWGRAHSWQVSCCFFCYSCLHAHVIRRSCLCSKHGRPEQRSATSCTFSSWLRASLERPALAFFHEGTFSIDTLDLVRDPYHWALSTDSVFLSGPTLLINMTPSSSFHLWAGQDWRSVSQGLEECPHGQPELLVVDYWERERGRLWEKTET